MFCRKCGNQLYDGDIFCNRCGAPVNPEQPGVAMPQDAHGFAPNPNTQGLAPGARDSERIIEEFYRANRRREEAQAILNMEYSSIKGESVDLSTARPQTYSGREDFFATVPQVSQFAPQVTPTPQYQQPAPQQPAPQQTVAPAQPVAPQPAPAQTVAPQPAAPQQAAPAQPAAPQPAAPAQPAAPKFDPKAPQAPRAPKYADKMVETPHIFNVKVPEPKPEPEPPKIDATPQAPRAPKYSSKMVDTPHIMHIGKQKSDSKPAAPQQAAPATPQQAAPATPQQAAAAPASATPQPAAPVQPTQPAPQPAAPVQPAQPVQPAPQPSATSMNQFEGQKASIDQKAKVTLDMLDQLFADFNKPIADSVGLASAAAAAGVAAGAATMTDLGSLAPATASGIATGQAMQKAVLEPEEEPPEDGFEDDYDFFTDADGVDSEAEDKEDASGASAAVTSATTDGAKDSSDTDKESSEEESDRNAKKEKKGFFRRKAKEEPEEIEEEEEDKEEETTSNIQKRPNVIVLNPEFLNEDEKASGKHTEDFRIASNMTHGVKAMDRVTPQDEEDEEEEYYVPERRGNTARKAIMGILTALLLLAAVISILITFGRETKAGQAILDFWDNIRGVESEEEPESEAELQENGEAEAETETAANTENTETAETEHHEEQQAAESGEEGTEGTVAGETETGENEDETASEFKHIVNEDFNAAEGGFGESIQEPELTMEAGREYYLDDFYSSSIFVDSEWYTNEEGESVTYNDAIFYMVTDYYQKLVERMNRDSEEVLELIVPDTKLMTDVSGIKADAIVLHAITKLEVGETRRNGDNYYVIVQINEVTNDGRPASTYKRVLRLVADEENHKLMAAEVVVGD